jgi:hypothetical protein
LEFSPLCPPAAFQAVYFVCLDPPVPQPNPPDFTRSKVSPDGLDVVSEPSRGGGYGQRCFGVLFGC